MSQSEILNAIAVKTGFTNSQVGTAIYIVNLASSVLPAPAFSPAGGTYTSTQTATISAPTAGATIYYTTNGATPTTASTVNGPISVSATETLQAIAVKANFTNSPVATAIYTIGTALPAADVLTRRGHLHNIPNGDYQHADCWSNHLLHNQWNRSHHRVDEV